MRNFVSLMLLSVATTGLVGCTAGDGYYTPNRSVYYSGSVAQAQSPRYQVNNTPAAPAPKQYSHNDPGPTYGMKRPVLPPPRVHGDDEYQVSSNAPRSSGYEVNATPAVPPS